jgi:hypothetical protein
MSTSPDDKVWTCIQYPKPSPYGEAAKKIDVDDAVDCKKILTMVFQHKQDVATTKTFTYLPPESWESKDDVKKLVKRIG